MSKPSGVRVEFRGALPPSNKVYGRAVARLDQVAPIEAQIIRQYVRGLRAEAAAWRVRATSATEGVSE